MPNDKDIVGWNVKLYKQNKSKEPKPNLAQMLKCMSHSWHRQTCWDFIPSGQRSRSQMRSGKTQERLGSWRNVYVKLMSNNSEGQTTSIGRSLAWLLREFTGEVLQKASARSLIIVGWSWVQRTKCKQMITVCKSEVGVFHDMLFRHRIQQTTTPASLKRAFKSTY